MSRKRIVSTLTSLGLSKAELRIYVFIAMEGPQEIRTLAKALKITQNEAVNSLEILKNKGLVTVMNSVIPSEVYALSFEKALDLLVENNLKQAQITEQNKTAILEDWDSMIKNYQKNEVNR